MFAQNESCLTNIQRICFFLLVSNNVNPMKIFDLVPHFAFFKREHTQQKLLCNFTLFPIQVIFYYIKKSKFFFAKIY